MNDQFWQSLPREDCGVKRVHLLRGWWIAASIEITLGGIAWLIWHFV